MPSLTNQPAAIDIAHVDVRRGDLHILQDTSAAVPQGSSTVLVGPNGAGKSTLLHCIINEIAYTGEIRMQGSRGRRPRLAYVPQNLQMDSALPLTVAEFLSLGHQRRPLWLGIKSSASRRARAALAPVHAEHLIRRRMSDLSGGELRRVLLAAALAREPEILLLDEPAAGVDFQGERLFWEVLDTARRQQGFTQLMVTHNLPLAAHYADHVIGLNKKVVAQGPPQQTLLAPTLMKLFGVPIHLYPNQCEHPEAACNKCATPCAWLLRARKTRGSVMPDISAICHMFSLLPLDCLKLSFMQQALLAVLLLTPMTAALGVEVISFRMAFFSDAIGHSAFAGVALGLLLSVDPHWSMPAFGVLVGLAVMAVRRGSALSSDTVIGIVFSAVVAFGLAVVSRQPGMARTMQQFLYGDVLTVSQGEILCLAILFVALLIFQIIGYNRLLYIALNPVMARVHGINVCLWQYIFSGLLALVVMFCVWTVGVLLVTAMLIVPAAAGRNFAQTAITSGVAGLLLSAQEWMSTASGATMILVACVWFALSSVWTRLRRPHRLS